MQLLVPGSSLKFEALRKMTDVTTWPASVHPHKMYMGCVTGYRYYEESCQF